MTPKAPAFAAPAVALALVLAAGAGGAARAQAPAAGPPPLNDATQLFCKDDNGQLRLMKFATLGNVVRRFQTRFAFGLTIQPRPFQLIFSDPEHSPYSITYEAQAYDDGEGHSGVALLSMHLFLDNADRDITGSQMCFFTEFGR